MNRSKKMTEDTKKALAARGQMSRPVGWARGDRRKALKARRLARVR